MPVDGNPRRGRRTGVVARVAAVIAVLAATGGASASANVTVLQGNEAATSLPTWTNLYAWPNEHGYAGWDERELTPGYAFAAGRPSAPGLWLWPEGDRQYGPGEAFWSYEAPGTTRLLRATVDLSYPPRLLAHHCIRVALRAGSSQPDSKFFCKPPGPPAGEGNVQVRLGDPQGNPSSKLVTVGLELPCEQRNRASCEKHLSAGDADGDGLQVRLVDMVLVDDDSPQVTPSGAFFELNGTYIDGRRTYPLRVDVADAGAGISRTRVEHSGWPGPQPDLADRAAACDPRHHTPALGSRICPPSDGFEQMVDTRPMPEGTRRFRASAADPAGNVGERRWTVIIDRTPPTTPSVSFSTPEEGSALPLWDAASDPILPDGTDGSGVAGYRVRHRIGDGGWSEWAAVGAGERAGDEVYDQPAGTEVAFEVVAVDAVGNVSDVARTSGRVFGTPPTVSALDRLAEAAGGYLGDGSFPVTIDGDDGDGVGVKRLGLRELGGREFVSAPGECAPRTRPDGRPWKAECASTSSETLTVDMTSVPEGRKTFVAEAVDRANNVGETRWEVTVDRTPPVAPTADLTAMYSDELDETDVFWPDATDPPLADGTPGSGVAGYVYRFRRAGGNWSGWLETDATTFDFAGSFAGETISVELRSRDAAGNLSDAVSDDMTVETSNQGFDVAFFADDEDLEIAVAASASEAERGAVTPDGRPARMLSFPDAVASPAGRDAIWDAGIDEPVVSAAREPLERRVGCQIGSRNEGEPSSLESYFGERHIAIRVELGAYCFPANPRSALDVKFATQTTLRITACLQVDDGSGFRNIRCDTGSRKGTHRERRLELEATQLCFAGFREYRTQVRSRASAPGLKAAKSTITPDPVRRSCNEAGAWRRVATRDGSWGERLGNSLISSSTAEIDRDRLPRGDGRGKWGGWEPHHIVSANDGRGTNSLDRAVSAVQQLAWTCNNDRALHPNNAINGVWLRGPRLFSNKPGWEDLTTHGRRRPAHQPIHSTDHFDWVKRHLDNHATSRGTCLSYGGMKAEFRRVREIIIAGDAPS